MYKCKYFTIAELVPTALRQSVSESTLWTMFDDRLLRCADLIREKYGQCTVNGGALADCGLRDPHSATGAKYSMHKIGRALDLHILSVERAAAKFPAGLARKKFKTGEYNHIRTELMADARFNCLNFETGITWLHIDTGNRANRQFNP